VGGAVNLKVTNQSLSNRERLVGAIYSIDSVKKEDDSQPARHSQRDEAAVRVVPETGPRAVRQVQSDVLLVSIATRCAPDPGAQKRSKYKARV